ncbi:MAG: glycosyltransferase family 4 protein [Candidatus Micrarchaeota archaeon]
MRIAYFVWEYPPRLVGGLGTYASEITRKFIEQGHELTIFTMNDDGKLKTREDMGGIEVHRPMVADASNILPVFVDEEVKKWGTGVKFFSDILSYNILSANKFVNQVAKEKQFDIIACHDWLSCISGVVAKKNTNKPLVFHVHSTEHGRSGGKGSKTVSDLEAFTASIADMIMTVSYAMQEELHILKYPQEKIRVSWNGVDEKKYNMDAMDRQKVKDYRAGLGLKENEKMILFTGRLTWVKGIDNLVQALPSILTKAPDTKLVILGRGEMADTINNLGNQLKLHEKIVLIDRWVSEEERLLLYASSDVVCAPSRYEPFGIISLEAMGMKKPIVVGNGGLREAVLDGKTGFYCNPESPDSIAGALLKLLVDPELARTFGESGRKRVEKLFTWDKIAEDTIALYESLL